MPACAVKTAGAQASSAGQASRRWRRSRMFTCSASSAQHTPSTCDPARCLVEAHVKYPLQDLWSHFGRHGPAQLRESRLCIHVLRQQSLRGPLQHPACKPTLGELQTRVRR